MPGKTNTEKLFRAQLHSISICKIKLSIQKGEDKEYVHPLNSTAIATSRALEHIETYQNKYGLSHSSKALFALYEWYNKNRLNFFLINKNNVSAF
jgi:hypothetical protein